MDKYLHEIHRKESEGIRRNEQFLKELSRASRSANMLNEKTEKLQEIRVSLTFFEKIKRHIDVRAIILGYAHTIFSITICNVICRVVKPICSMN